MTYDELTNEQKSVLQDWLNVLRALAGEQARTNNHAAAVDVAYGSQIQDILTALDAGEVLPNTSGLAGAQGLPKEEVISVVAHFQGIRTNYDTTGHRQLWTKLCGTANMIG